MIKKNIFFAVSACFLGSFSHLFLSFGLGLVILEKTKSALEFGISQFSAPIVCFILAPILTKCIHYFSLKVTIISSLVANLIISLLLATFLYLNPPPSLLTLIVTLLLGLNGIFSYSFSIAYTISCKYIVSEGEIRKLKSMEEIVGSCALILSPIVAAMVYNRFSSWQYIIISILLDFLTLGVIFSIRFKEDKSDPTESNQVLKHVNLGLTKLIPYAILPAIMGFCFSSINVGIPFIQIHHLHLSTSEYGTVKMAWALGMFLSGIILTHHQKDASLKESIALLSLTLLLTSIFFLLSKEAYWIMLAFNFLFSYWLVRYRVALSTRTLESFSGDCLNRIILTQKNFDQLFRAAGIVLFGLLYDHLVYTSVLLLTGIIMLVVASYYTLRPSL